MKEKDKRRYHACIFQIHIMQIFIYHTIAKK